MAQILRSDADIAVVDQQVIVARLGNHVDQVADFPIGTQTFRANQQTNPLLRKFALQLFDQRHGWIFHTAGAEKNLDLAGIIRPAVWKTPPWRWSNSCSANF